MSAPAVNPIFTVSAPDCGGELLWLALIRADGVWSPRAGAGSFLDRDPGAFPGARDRELSLGHRLTSADTPALTKSPAELLVETILDREGTAYKPEERSDAGPPTVVAGGGRLALQVNLLADAFPHARFVAGFREPAEAIPDMLRVWQSGQRVIAQNLEGWSGAPWSLPLIPGWPELNGLELEEVVTRQWITISTVLLDDLEALEPSRWAVFDRAALIGDPRTELQRLCGWLGLRYDQALLSPAEQVARTTRGAAISRSVMAAELLELAEPVAVRWRELLARTPQADSARARAQGSAAGVAAATEAAAATGAGAAAWARSADGERTSEFGSASTPSFIATLKRLKASLLISTYQSGRLICAREQDGLLNTHFRQFDKPMGIAVGPGRFALATRTEVIEFRDHPQVAPKLTPPGHDACYIPIGSHVTGDALMHEMVYLDGELWGSATKFSCLTTFDREHSFVPRWKPPFIEKIADGDRCHLNGICAVDDKLAYVTALGTTDEPRGWTAGKASGGVIMEFPSGEIVCAGLSMPHSPRIVDGQLYVLESGRGALNSVDLASGRTEQIVELPGFTRGLAISGRFAFVGLSQIRESSTFGDLPLTKRLQERICGVWLVDLVKAKNVGFLQFDGIVQEIFDVQLLPNRFPEIAEVGSSAAATTFRLP